MHSAVDRLRLPFDVAMQFYIVQSISAKANGIPFYAKLSVPASYSLTSSAVGKSIAR